MLGSDTSPFFRKNLYSDGFTWVYRSFCVHMIYTWDQKSSSLSEDALRLRVHISLLQLLPALFSDRRSESDWQTLTCTSFHHTLIETSWSQKWISFQSQIQWIVNGKMKYVSMHVLSEKILYLRIEITYTHKYRYILRFCASKAKRHHRAHDIVWFCVEKWRVTDRRCYSRHWTKSLELQKKLNRSKSLKTDVPFTVNVDPVEIHVCEMGHWTLAS